MTASIDISGRVLMETRHLRDLRAFWADEATFRFEPHSVPSNLTREWVMDSSRVPWLELDLPIPEYEAMDAEALALRSRFVGHRDDGHSGWKSLALHGIDSISTRSPANYGFASEDETPYGWTEIAGLCPVTTSFLKRLPFRKLYRVRFMLLEPEGSILPHLDTWTHGLCALNIALSNPPGAYFKMRDRGCVPFTPGRAFLVDISNVHSCINTSNLPRIHIIVHFGEPAPEWDDLVCRSFRQTWLAATAARKLRTGTAVEAGCNMDRLNRIRLQACKWVERGGTQALVYLVARHGVVVAREAFGHLDSTNESARVGIDTVFRMSSVSKVVTATLAMILIEDGQLSLTRPVAEYLPEFQGHDDILVHHLLTHTSGLHPEDYDVSLNELNLVARGTRPDLRRMVRAACVTRPRQRAGERFIYGGVNYVLLGEIIERCAGCSLNSFAQARLFNPLSMSDTQYGLDDRFATRCIRLKPEIFRDVQPPYDPNDLLDLQIPHPGGHLFSTAADMAVFGQMFLNGGRYGANRILSPAAVQTMTRNQIPGIPATSSAGCLVPEASWGLGWMVQGSSQWKRSHGTLQSLGTYYHQGAAGVALWCDPNHDILGVFLSTIRSFDASSQSFDWDFDLFQNLVTAAVE
jgi:CubicO group peptidase (beta-lactamase class C family)